jgi:exonuclease III
VTDIAIPPKDADTLRIVSWNVAGKPLWPKMIEIDADIGLLQEAAVPVDPWPRAVIPQPSEHWGTAGWTGDAWRRRTAIVQVDDRHPLRAVPLAELGSGQEGAVPVSHAGALAVCELEFAGEDLAVASVYAPWERARTGVIFADASAHRLLSDLSTLVATTRHHRLIVAGDLNILHGYGEEGDPYWAARYQTVFDRAEAMGLSFVGPQAPNGRQADPWPDELPMDSHDVPTYRTSQQTPRTATRQLDFVFASTELADRLDVHALNQPDDWGPSDHCRVVIDLGPPGHQVAEATT